MSKFSHTTGFFEIYYHEEAICKLDFQKYLASVSKLSFALFGDCLTPCCEEERKNVWAFFEKSDLKGLFFVQIRFFQNFFADLQADVWRDLTNNCEEIDILSKTTTFKKQFFG